MRKLITDSYYYNSRKFNNRASQLGFNIIYVTNIDFYKDKNLLSTVDGTQAINKVFESICKVLGNK